MKRTDWQARKFATLDLSQEDSLSVAKQFVDLLSKLTISKLPTSNDDPSQLPSDQIEFVATSKQIVNAFERYCARHNMQNPYTKANFIKCLPKEEKSMKPSGWEIVRKEGNVAPYYKIIKGDRFIKLRKTIVR